MAHKKRGESPWSNPRTIFLKKKSATFMMGAGTGGVIGGLIGALVGMGIPEYEAKRYEGMIREGRILLSAHCDNSDWVKRAKHILGRTGAQDVASAGESKSGLRQVR
jgi:hypothetical protein